MRLRRQASILISALLALAPAFLPAAAPQSKPTPTALAPIELIVEGLGHLEGIAVDETGGVFVSDRERGEILKVMPGVPAATVVGELKRPLGLALDAEGRLVFVEGGERRVLRVEEDGRVTTLASGLKHPRWIGAAPDGSLYVTAKELTLEEEEGAQEEDEGEIIARISPAGTLGIFAGQFRDLQGVAVEQDALTVVARGRRGERHALGTIFEIPIEPGGRAGIAVPLTADQLVEPRGLAAGRLGSRFVSAKSLAMEPWRRHVVLRVEPDGSLTVFAEGLEDPQGLAFGADGSLYLADGRSGRVVRFVAPPPPALEEQPPTFTNQRRLELRLRSEAGAQLTVAGGELPVSVLADDRGSALVSITLRANAENRLAIFSTAAGGGGLTSAPLEVTVVHDDRPPSVELVAPRSGSLVRGTIGAEALAFDSSGIAEVEFRLDGVLVGLDTTAPFRLSLDTRAGGDGSRTLSAVARDRAGNVASAIAQLTVDNTPPEIRIASPLSGSITTGPFEVIVEARDATSGVAKVEVAVNGEVRAAAEAPPYRFPLEPQSLGPGPYVLVATATDLAGNRAGSAPVSLVLSGLSVEITEPADGARVSTGPLLVRGRVETGGAEAGVTVNGFPAAVQGAAFAALVPVAPDITSLTAIATTATGLTATHSVAVSVSATAAPPIVLVTSPATGVAPVTARFSLLGASAPVSIALDFDGNGTVDFTGPTLDGQAFPYTQSGLYLPTATITDAQGQRLTASGIVQVYDTATLDALLQVRWTAMKDALRAGDIARAVSNITARTRADYQAAFNIISARLPAIDSILTDITLVKVRNASAIYEMTRVDDGILLSFGVRFAIDEDGIWRIEAF